MNAADKIIKAIESAPSWATSFGIRKHFEVVSVGDELPNSKDWDHDNDCSSDMELEGVCALSFDADDLEDIEYTLEMSSAYAGKLILICGTGEEYGEDDGEVIIANAECLLTL